MIDCSERGLRYEVTDRRLPSLGTPLAGVLEFRRGAHRSRSPEKSFDRAADIVVLSLDAPGIPFAQILAEQRYLRGSRPSARTQRNRRLTPTKEKRAVLMTARFSLGQSGALYAAVSTFAAW